MRHQRIVVAVLQDAAVAQHINAIGVADGRGFIMIMIMKLVSVWRGSRSSESEAVPDAGGGARAWQKLC